MPTHAHARPCIGNVHVWVCTPCPQACVRSDLHHPTCIPSQAARSPSHPTWIVVQFVVLVPSHFQLTHGSTTPIPSNARPTPSTTGAPKARLRDACAGRAFHCRGGTAARGHPGCASFALRRASSLSAAVERRGWCLGARWSAVHVPGAMFEERPRCVGDAANLNHARHTHTHTRARWRVGGETSAYIYMYALGGETTERAVTDLDREIWIMGFGSWDLDHGYSREQTRPFLRPPQRAPTLGSIHAWTSCGSCTQGRHASHASMLVQAYTPSCPMRWSWRVPLLWSHVLRPGLRALTFEFAQSTVSLAWLAPSLCGCTCMYTYRVICKE